METNEHDITKLMLETIRTKTSNHKNLIRENEANPLQANEIGSSDTTNSNEEDSDFQDKLEGFEKDYYDKDVDAFSERVTNDVTFTNFNIDKETQNVVFSGTLGNGLEWSYSKKGGVQLGTSVGNKYISITKDDILVLNKLVQNYDIWKDTWDKNFRTESILKNK